ncbi:unnamed protein product, partial [Brassica napus]
MAFNRDLKLKKPIIEDYSYSLEEAFNKGKNETRDRYRAMLFMYQNQLEAITAKHDEEREVYRVQGKLELLKELFKKDARRKEKNKLKTELVLAKEKMDGSMLRMRIGTNDKENTPMGNITQNSSITNVSPLPNRLTHQARAARKEILNNKRTIGLTTSNRGTIDYQETISRSTLRKRKTIGTPPSVN